MTTIIDGIITPEVIEENTIIILKTHLKWTSLYRALTTTVMVSSNDLLGHRRLSA